MSRRYGIVFLLMTLLLLQAVPLPASASNHLPSDNPENAMPVRFDQSPAIFWEGDPVSFSASSSVYQTTIRKVRVFCVDGCPANPTYEAAFHNRMTFPSASFCQLENGLPNCDLPRANDLLEPRWAGTWAVTLNDAAGVEIYRRTFDVEMIDTRLHPQGYTVTQNVEVVAGGFPPTSYPTLSFGNHDGDGNEVILANYALHANSRGQIDLSWYINKWVAIFITDAGCDGGCTDFFARVTAEPGSGSDKQQETIPFTIKPAELEPVIFRGPSFLEDNSTSYERTETVDFGFSMWYTTQGFTQPGDFASIGAPGSLRVEIRRIDPDTENWGLVDALAPRYFTAGVWLVEWEIPKDVALKTPEGKAYEFQLVVPEGRDAYGNKVLRNASAVFTIDPARLEAEFLLEPSTLQRTETGAWFTYSKYHNGMPFNGSVNASRLKGHMVRLTDAGDVPVPDSTAYGKHNGNGTWQFRFAFPKDYAHPGRHAFVFDGGGIDGRDKWGNYIQTNRSSVFNVTVAIPRVHLTEKAGDDLLNASTGWERGQRLHFVARTTYPDGTAYNSTHHMGQGVFNVTLIKRQGSNEVERVILPFRERSLDGTWTASYALTLTDRETPLGTWSLVFDFEDHMDPPNAGQRVVDRSLHPARIRVYGDPIYRSSFLLGETVRWTFDLEYADGRAATDVQIATLTVDVYRWSGQGLLGVEEQDLPARYHRDRGWTVEWQPPTGIQLGEFVFVPKGTDKYGNPLEDDHSPAFRVHVPTKERDVLAHPPPVVVRGETVYVSFDGLQGDTGENGTGHPRITVERWTGRSWVIEVEDVYASSADRPAGSGDHYGAWATSAFSTLGTYRFAFYGRDAQRAYVNATSAGFELVPLEATRQIVQPPPESVDKGVPMEFYVERRAGDQLAIATVTQYGEDLGRARLEPHNATTWRIEWSPSFRLPGGNYTIEVSGTDIDGNRLLVATPAIAVHDIAITSNLVREPPPRVDRGGKATFTFRAFLPDGSLTEPLDGKPTVYLERDGEVVQELRPVFVHPNWDITWEVPMDIEMGEYRFHITGKDKVGNRFASTFTGNVTVRPGVVEREFTSPPKSSFRLNPIVASAVANRTDTSMSCYAAYAGTSPRDSKTARDGPAVTTLNITFEWNPGDDVYDLSWTPGRATPTGWYRYECRGTDVHQNDVRYRSFGFQVNAVTLNVAPMKQFSTTEEEFGPGVTTRFYFNAFYPDKDRTTFTPDIGLATARLLYNGVPVEPQPEVRYDETVGAWVAEWTAPDVLPNGRYIWASGGRDPWGNVVPSHILASFEVEPTVSERLFGIPGFDKAVPGVDAVGSILALVAAIAVASFARRRR